MTEEIKAIIEKQLPAQVGDILKKTLEQGKQDAKDLQIQKEVNINLNNVSAGLVQKLEEYKKFDSRNAGLDVREAEITKRENDRKVWEAETRAAEAEKRAAELASIVQTVFKSPVYRKSTYGNSSVPYNPQGTNSAPFNKTTDVTEE